MKPVPRIVETNAKLLVGMSMTMSLIKNQTAKLWQQFGPRIHEIGHRVSNDKFSLQVYDADHFQRFNPANTFTKWALVEVNEDIGIPEGLNRFELDGGLYAVFEYKGLSTDPSIFQYIYSEWLPLSEFQLDNRPHFEVLGEKYRNNDPNSEEEIWVPVRRDF